MSQQKKILFLAKLYKPHIGGVEKHVEMLCRELLLKGYDVTILTERYKNSLRLYEQNSNIEIYRIPVGKNQFSKKFYIWKWIFANIGLLLKADIIHVHDVFYWIIPFRIILFWKKIFITFHGYEGFPVKSRWVVIRMLSERLSNGSICVGDFIKKWYHAKPNVVIYGAVKKAKKVKIPKKNTAVFFGRLDEQTGITNYIKAYEMIKKEIKDFKLTIVGEGKLKRTIPKEIKVIPFSKNTDKYISENQFVFVSRYLSMLEALIQKRIVVANYDNPIKKDYLIKSPFKKYVFVANKPEEMSKFVTKYDKNRKKIENMVQNGYFWAETLTWEKLANIYINLWKI